MINDVYIHHQWRIQKEQGFLISHGYAVAGSRIPAFLRESVGLSIVTSHTWWFFSLATWVRSRYKNVNLRASPLPNCRFHFFDGQRWNLAGFYYYLLFRVGLWKIHLEWLQLFAQNTRLGVWHFLNSPPSSILAWLWSSQRTAWRYNNLVYVLSDLSSVNQNKMGAAGMLGICPGVSAGPLSSSVK